MRKPDPVLYLTTLACLLPLLAGVFLWNRLPAQVPIHWNYAGQVDGYGARGLLVFGIPAGMAAAHLLLQFLLNYDPRRQNMAKALRALTLWLLPAMSIILCGLTYLQVLGISAPVQVIVPLLIGVLFLAIGNYLPKCRTNYTMGIRTPWTLDSPENWSRTHRLGGYCFAISGLMLMLCAIPGLWWLLFPAICLSGLVPVIYSFILYKKGI